ncbi:dual specificity protein phosphatase family protein [uncultured Thiodictyon sp.]|uniref:fused DSP-PTPase phosphatase/NAD kinase-like protein n=1 Tax=uncultured Thiodictyon sp. TaxID=1846217 RepID=UPI0025E8E0F3|nr:dual specificity protein phosphatase family protein [uncultured Thiodictyon sp.]
MDLDRHSRQRRTWRVAPNTGVTPPRRHERESLRLFSMARQSSLAMVLLWSLSILSCAAPATPGAVDACTIEHTSPIRNFCAVRPGVLWRGAKPDQQGAAWLIAQGVRTIVNLELVNEDDSAFRRANVADQGFHEVRLFRLRDSELAPIMPTALEDNRVAWFLSIVDQQPQPVYVHCREGQNRTGVMVAAYRVIVEGVSAERAIEEMRRYHGMWFDTSARYIRALSPQRIDGIRRQAKARQSHAKEDARVVCAKGTCTVADD